MRFIVFHLPLSYSIIPRYIGLFLAKFFLFLSLQRWALEMKTKNKTDIWFMPTWCWRWRWIIKWLKMKRMKRSGWRWKPKFEGIESFMNVFDFTWIIFYFSSMNKCKGTCIWFSCIVFSSPWVKPWYIWFRWCVSGFSTSLIFFIASCKT